MSDLFRQCHCHRNRKYEVCCRPLLDGLATANTAEQLMRSRYSAFCEGNIHYLIATLHPDYRQQHEESALQSSIEQTQWLGLKVLDSQDSGDAAKVEFVAYYAPKAEPMAVLQIHEASRFCRQDNQWFYLDGKMLADIYPGRNEACFCGSDSKYKKCHGLYR